MSEAPDSYELEATLAFEDLIRAENDEVEAILACECLLEDENNETERFETLVTQNDIDQRAKERVPKKTQESTMWAFNIYKAWAKFRNSQLQTLSEEYPFAPVEELKTASKKEINFWLTRFILEINKGDGTPYPANSLYLIACGLLRYFRDNLNRCDVNILAKGNPDFQSFRNSLDSRMKEMTASAIGNKRRSADPLTDEDEEKLWSSGTIGLASAQSLSYGVFFYNCKVFGFRAMNEHVNLMVEQYEFGTDSGGMFLNFTGRLSKNVQGGLSQRKIEVKRVKQYGQLGNPRCVVNLFREYMRCTPKAGRFYRKPLPNKEVGDIRFGTLPVGINTLSKYFSSMCSAANIDIQGRRFTNHSGKVTCATSLYEKEFDEQTIMSRTGHRSLAVRSYKRASSTMVKAVSDALQPKFTAQENKKMKCDDNGREKRENPPSSANTMLTVKHGDTELTFNFSSS